MAKLLFLLSIFLTPEQSIDMAASAMERPDLADDLKAIAWRESRMESIGIHVADEHLDGYWGQVKINRRGKARGIEDPGHIDEDCQDHTRVPGMWATHGILGLSASSHWEYLPHCYDPKVLDIPLISALVAMRKYERRCLNRRRRRGWCRIPKRFRGERDPRRNNLPYEKAHTLPARGKSLEEWLDAQLENRLTPENTQLS